MIELLKHRGTRIGCCLMLMVGVWAFLLWDAGPYHAQDQFVAGPWYLVLWLGVIAVGAAALFTLLLDLSMVAFHRFHRRRVEGSPGRFPGDPEGPGLSMSPRP